METYHREFHFNGAKMLCFLDRPEENYPDEFLVRCIVYENVDDGTRLVTSRMTPTVAQMIERNQLSEEMAATILEAMEGSDGEIILDTGIGLIPVICRTQATLDMSLAYLKSLTHEEAAKIADVLLKSGS